MDEVLSLAHKSGQLNGSALVAEDSRVIYKNGFGMANMEWGAPNIADMRFPLGSIMKQFTAVLTLQLVEQGKLKLDRGLPDYLPDCRPDTGQKVTTHHLLTRTSGMPSYTGQPEVEVFPESETTFFPRAFNAKLTFVKDSHGRVTGIRIGRGGGDTHGKKIK